MGGTAMALTLASNREIVLSNQEFLEAIFGEEWGKAHVTSFVQDPENITEKDRPLCWAGGPASDRLESFLPNENQFFTISLFNPTEEGRAARRKALFDATFVIVADDVSEKLDPDAVAKLPEPSYKLHSSAGSEQWGWILDYPCDNQNHVENLLDGLVAKGLAPDGVDPGMKGVTRYVRLPGGVNTKAKRYVEGKPFNCYISEWEPTRLHSIKTLAAVFNIDLNAERGTDISRAASSEVVKNHPVWKYVTALEMGNDGWVRIECVNANAHTADDPTGAAIRVIDDGSIQYQCHHGHCNGERNKKITGARALEILSESHPNIASEVRAYCMDLKREGLEAMRETGLTGRTNPPADEASPNAILHNQLDPDRYIYLAPENKFYDTKAGTLLTPAGLNGRYLRQLPGKKGAPTASEVLQSTLSPQTEADSMGWNPTGLSAPPRSQLVFSAGGKRLVNTWDGIALSPVVGDVSPWLDLVEYLIPNVDEREVVLDFLAYTLQHVGRKPGFAIGHRGHHRIGKDLMYRAMMEIFGSASNTIDIDNVLGGWGDYIRGIKFAVITEVDREQDHKVANSMKIVIAPTASGVRSLNIKGGSVVIQRDVMACVMMSNKRAFMKIEEGDKRYFIISSWVQPKPREYYQAIDQWYEHDNGSAKVLNFLLSRDLSNFNAQTLPFMTEGALEMVKSGRYDYEQELEDLIYEGVHPFNMGAVTTKELRLIKKEYNLKGGINGIDDALLRLGWSKFRGYKKVDGVTKATPTFYASGLGSGANPAEIYDFYVGHREL